MGEAICDKIAEGVVKREEVFVATKASDSFPYFSPSFNVNSFETQMWCTYHDPERVEYACRKSLENLGLDYIDLYIMHFPIGFVYHGDDKPWPKNADGTQETK